MNAKAPRPQAVPDEPPWDPDYDQTLPAAEIEAEQALLGCLILAPAQAEQIRLELDAGDFYQPRNETIWDAAHTIAADPTIKLDAVTLLDELRRRGELERIGGGPYIHSLIAQVPNVQNYSAYAKIVRDAARLRQITNLGTLFTQLGRGHDPDKVNQTIEMAVNLLDEAAGRFGPRTTGENSTGLADLTWLHTGQPPAIDPPAYTWRTDGHALFYSGAVNGIFGDPEGGKTWLAQTAIVEALNAGGTAAMIDVDHNGQNHTAARLLLLGARLDHLADPERFRYYEPEEADQLVAATHQITRLASDVVVIDSLGEVLPMLNVKSVDNDEITSALRLVCTPPAKAGSCVITIDHLPKSTEARSTGYAIGGTAKKRIMRGSYIRVEARTQPAPGQIGRMSLRIEKDTLGELRKNTPGGFAGTFVLDSTKPGITSWQVTLEDSPVTADGKFRPTHLMELVSRYVEDNDGASKNDIETTVKGTAKHIRAAIDVLVEEGFLSRIQGAGRGGGYRFHVTMLYRANEDDIADADGPSDQPRDTQEPLDPWANKD